MVKRILIADDEPIIRDVLSLTLKKEGYAVREAEDGEMAIEVFEQVPFDLVVSDLLMPNRDGIELLRHVRNSNSTIPVLMMSSGGEMNLETLKQVCMHLGASSFIQKPFLPSTLLEKIKHALACDHLKDAGQI